MTSIIGSNGVSQIDMTTMQQFNINSDVDSLNVSDTTNNFNVRLDIDWYRGADRIAIGDVAIPKSFYVINSSNNTFIINENGVNHTITIPVGNYSINNLITALTTQTNLAGLTGTYAYSIPNPNITGKLSVQITANYVNPTYLQFTNTLFEVLGGPALNEPIAGVSFNNLPGTIALSNSNVQFPYAYNLNAYNNMYLLCDLVGGNNSQATSNIICAFYPHTSALFSYAVDEFDIVTKSKAISKHSNVINFQIVDQFKNPIDFNGIAISFSLYIFKLKNDK